MRIRAFALIAALAALPSASRADFTILDDFNRPDAATLGPNWSQWSGSTRVASGMAVGGGPTNLAIFDGMGGSSVTADLYAGGGIFDFAALVIGFRDRANNLYVKLQQNGGTAGFDRVVFCYGENVVDTSAWSGSGFTLMSAPTTSARATITLVGDTITLYIDTNFDGTADQTYAASGVPLGRIGTGIGIASRGNARIDNFGGTVFAIPEPSSIILASLSLACVGGFALRRRP